MIHGQIKKHLLKVNNKDNRTSQYRMNNRRSSKEHILTLFNTLRFLTWVFSVWISSKNTITFRIQCVHEAFSIVWLLLEAGIRHIFICSKSVKKLKNTLQKNVVTLRCLWTGKYSLATVVKPVNTCSRLRDNY